MAIVTSFQDAFNNDNLLDRAGLFYIATEYLSNGSVTRPDGDGTNEDESIDEMAAYNFENAGWFTDAQVSLTLENEKVKESDACNNEEIDNSVDIIPTFTITLQEMGNIDLLAKMMGLQVQVTPVTPKVGLTMTKQVDAFSSFAKVIDFKENTAGSITSITGSVDGLYVVAVDYTLTFGTDGSVGFDLTPAAGVSTLDQDFVVVYDETPKAKSQLVMKNGTRSMPYLLLRFCECDTTPGQVSARIHYMAKVRVSSETVLAFVNESRSDFAGATMTFTGAKDGNYAQSEITL